MTLFGSRHGYPKAPAEDFTVTLRDDALKPIAAFPLPHATFARGEPKWVTMKVKPTEVPARFVLRVGFDPGPTKGVYVHHDAGSGKSPVALPGDAEPQPFPKGDWLIRAVLDPPRPGS